MDYKKIIYECLNNNVKNCVLVSKTNNIVYRVTTKNNDVYYAKFYLNNSSHIDHELKLYNKVGSEYLKEIIYLSEDNSFAIYKELKGKTIDELSNDEINKYSDKITDSLIDFFTMLSNNKVAGYGLLDENMNGIYSDFDKFIVERQESTSKELKYYPDLCYLFKNIYDEYHWIIKGDNSLVPIDTNMKNIMLLNDESIKFCDPGELISGPILMGYGDYMAHTYKTVLCDKLLNKLKLNNNEKKLIRIYAVFSSLNILAFLHKNGVNNLKEIIPYGNKYTFYDLIDEHVKELGLKK